ncbi:MAG: leucine-rich repeat domain-containing protein, partial [Paludibacteraceae bacterium]
QNYLNYVHIQNNCMDFATLPLDSQVWQDYQYSQRDLPMEPVYKEGDTIDFSARVLRKGFLTDAIMYAIPMNTTDSFVMLDEEYFEWIEDKGLAVLKKAYPDSVAIEFSNSGFPVSDLFTEPFMIKTEADYGQPTKVMWFTTYESPVSFSVGLHGASAENPITFWVDLGTQELKECKATSETTPVRANVSGAKGYGPVAVYVPDGTNISALSIKNLYVSSIDLSQLNTLRELTLTKTQLYSIDLTYNRMLEVLNLSHNNLTTLNLEGENDYFNKNLLHTLDISYNSIDNTGYNAANFKLSPLLAMLHFNAAHNQLGDIDFSDADNLLTLDVSDNNMERLDFQHCTALDTVRASNNLLTEIILPEEDNIRYMDIASNQFTLANLPRHNAKLTEAGYLYAPQADIQIATMGPCTDLGAQMVDIDGKSTVLTWLKEDGTTLTEGTDYTIKNGFTRFLKEDLGKVYCEISHPAYPAFTGDKVLKTTKMQVAGMPTNKIASFVTAKDSDVVSLSLAAAKEGTSLYFDWEGNDNVVQYLLGTTYRLFSASTHKDVTVNVYTYEPTDTITVFSMTGATLSSFDGSKLLASTLTLQRAGLANLVMPENKSLMRELNLSGNALTTFNPSDYPNLYSLALTENQLTTLDLTNNKAIGLVGAASNKIASVKLKNPNLWYLDLSGNELTAIQVDTTTVPNMQQLGLNNNYLHTLDVASLEGLRALAIVGNRFDFSTLPPILPQYMVYNYSGQAMLEVELQDEKIIDLSTQAMVGDSATVFTWYLGEPVFNYDTYEWEGEVLIPGKEYTLENGVTTFLKPFDDVICLLTNPAFPDVYLYTDYFDVLQSMQGISQTESTTPTQVRKYMQNGVLLIERGGKTYTVLGETFR